VSVNRFSAQLLTVDACLVEAVDLTGHFISVL
jgi:hypothetical protein